jgi:hypothetical protein
MTAGSIILIYCIGFILTVGLLSTRPACNGTDILLGAMLWPGVVIFLLGCKLGSLL